MPQPARKAKTPTRSELSRELLEIERDNAALFARIDEIKTLLKLVAAADGKFRETFAELGYVSASPARPEEITGNAPVLQVGIWNDLREARRDKLIEDGIVRIEPIVKGAYHGRVDVKLHASPQGASK
jgi:hypothetical protein